MSEFEKYSSDSGVPTPILEPTAPNTFLQGLNVFFKTTVPVASLWA